MTTTKTAAAGKKESIPEVPVPPAATHDTRVATKRARVKGKLAKPVYLIHHGKSTITIPAVTQEYIENDPEAENFGEVLVDEVVPEQEQTVTLPKGSRYGSRKIGVAHEITDAQEAEDLKARGFVEATQAEVKKSEQRTNAGLSIDQVAARDRQRAQERLRRMGIDRQTADEDEE